MQTSRLDRRSSSGGMSRLFEGPAAWLVTFLVIPALIVAVLLLPPVSLLDRLQTFTYTRIGVNGGAITDPDGTIMNFPAEGIISGFRAQIKSTPRTDFVEGQAGNDLYEAAQNMPENLVAKSPVYHIDVRGREPAQAVVTIPIPNDSLPYETLSLYEWTGANWRHVPAEVLSAEDKIEARLDYVPKNFMVVQTTPSVPSVTMDLGLNAQLPQGASVTNVAQAGLRLRGDGGLDGQAPPNTGNTMPVVTNVEGETVRTDLVNNLLADPGLMDNQLMTLEQFVVGGPGSVRGYRTNALAGDDGFSTGLEVRLPLVSTATGRNIVSLLPFAEVGRIWNHARVDPETPTLSSLGAGVEWAPHPKLSFRVDGAGALRHVGPKNDLQDYGVTFRVTWRPR